MSKVIKYLPELEGDEQLHVATLLKNMTEEQAEQFAHVYRTRRRDTTTTLILALLGLFVVAGVHRFYLGQVGMGLLYLFTGGICLVGTVIDLVNHKKLTWQYNQTQALQVSQLILGAFPEKPRLEDGA